MRHPLRAIASNTKAVISTEAEVGQRAERSGETSYFACGAKAVRSKGARPVPRRLSASAPVEMTVSFDAIALGILWTPPTAKSLIGNYCNGSARGRKTPPACPVAV